MTLRKATSYTKPPLSAKPSKTAPGVIVVTAKLSCARQAHEWRYSTDGGASWIDLPFTLQSTTTVSGLTRGTTVLVRHRSVTRSGAGSWTDAVAVLVH